jgi:hypothetical protein
MLKFSLLLSTLLFCFIHFANAQTEHVYHFPSDTMAFDNTLPDYIDLVDGKRVEGKITKVDLIQKQFYDKITGTIAVGEAVYNLKDIKGYQYQGVYYSRADSKKHMIIRVKHGKINFYRQTMSMEKSRGGLVQYQWTHTRHFIQKGEDGDVKIFSYKLLKKYIADYQPAMDVIKHCEWNKKTWQGCEDLLEKAMEVYNAR